MATEWNAVAFPTLALSEEVGIVLVPREGRVDLQKRPKMSLSLVWVWPKSTHHGQHLIAIPITYLYLSAVVLYRGHYMKATKPAAHVPRRLYISSRVISTNASLWGQTRTEMVYHQGSVSLQIMCFRVPRVI